MSHFEKRVLRKECKALEDYLLNRKWCDEQGKRITYLQVKKDLGKKFFNYFLKTGSMLKAYQRYNQYLSDEISEYKRIMKEEIKIITKYMKELG